MTKDMKAKFARRSWLIHRKHGPGLSEEEASELEILARQVADYVERVAPRSTEKLDEFEALVGELEAGLSARRKGRADA